MAAAPVSTLMALGEVRDAAAVALAPQSDADPVVLLEVDSLYPPALVLDWADPWLQLGAGGVPAMGRCLWTARLQIIAVAGRLEPGPGVATLEQLVAYVVARLEADPYTWPLDSVSAPRQFDLAAVTYLGAAVTYLVPVTV